MIAMAAALLLPVSRRLLLFGAAAAIVAPPGLAAAPVPTPGQTEGPFYPVAFPPDVDNDLVLLKGSEARALGQVVHIGGQVIDTAGRPKPGAVVEIWQCDANGIYRHPRAPGQGRIDNAFQGYGRTEVDAGGSYRFRTIKPVPYPGRTPHIHFAVTVPGQGRLVTQMYIEGEPLNERDGVLRGIRDARARSSVIVALAPSRAEAGALQGRFDIVLPA
jgi:protocatechuate 3,4-dioxygenase, beta subunit